MAESSISVAQDEFLCAVCLELLKDPVTIPCGHSFCRSCITDFWDQKRDSWCPQCRETFRSRPAVAKNILITQLVEKFKRSKPRATRITPGPGDVECDLCIGAINKAFKSCLMCLNSYCQNHFERHEEFNSGKRHKVIEATGDLQKMICFLHRRPKDMFSRKYQGCVCYLCMADMYEPDETVSVGAERAFQQEKLEETQRRVQQRIQEREKELEELKEGIKELKRSADTAVEIRDREEVSVSQAKKQVKRLEKEIDDLRRITTELKKLPVIENHFEFLQKLRVFSVAAGPLDSSRVRGLLLNFEEVNRFLSCSRNEMESNSPLVKKILLLYPETREDFLEYFQNFTLDPDSANQRLLLSEGNRAVKYSRKRQMLPDHPETFDLNDQVMSSQSLRDRSYWEVEWRGDYGVDIAVGDHWTDRKEVPFGCNSRSWSLFCSPKRFFFRHNNRETDLPEASRSSRIGVYVDRGAGVLSFYSVSHTMSLIHSVRTSFSPSLYPGFNLNWPSSKVKIVAPREKLLQTR